MLRPLPPVDKRDHHPDANEDLPPAAKYPCAAVAEMRKVFRAIIEAEQWAAGISGPAYAMDDQTAIKVVDGTVEVVSEGHWKRFPS